MTGAPIRGRGGWALAGCAAAALFCLGGLADRQALFGCWLAAWWTCAGGVLGAQANLWLHDPSGGAWGLALRPLWRRAAAAMPMLLLLMLPLLGAVWLCYPWSRAGWIPDAAQAGFKAVWLAPTFVTARLIGYALLWQALALMPARRKGASAAGLLAYGVTISLAAVDLVMSLMPQWYSSGFGLLAVALHMKLGFALGVAGATGPGADGAGRRKPWAVFSPQLGRDWGNLLLMYVLMWAYLAFTQFLIVWAENLPHEIEWYVPRLQTGWVWLGMALAAGFFVPMALLLFRAVKQHRRRLRGLAAALCLLGWLESLWVTLPSIEGLSWHALWMAPLALLAMAALMCAAMPSARQAGPARPPVQTMRQPESGS